MEAPHPPPTIATHSPKEHHLNSKNVVVPFTDSSEWQKLGVDCGRRRFHYRENTKATVLPLTGHPTLQQQVDTARREKAATSRDWSHPSMQHPKSIPRYFYPYGDSTPSRKIVEFQELMFERVPLVPSDLQAAKVELQHHQQLAPRSAHLTGWDGDAARNCMNYVGNIDALSLGESKDCNQILRAGLRISAPSTMLSKESHSERIPFPPLLAASRGEAQSASPPKKTWNPSKPPSSKSQFLKRRIHVLKKAIKMEVQRAKAASSEVKRLQKQEHETEAPQFQM